MADQPMPTPPPEPDAQAAPEPAPAPTPSPPPPSAADMPWSQVWQFPLLLLGALMIGLAVWTSLPERQANDFDGALNDVALYTTANNLEKAQELLERIDPYINEATQPQQALHWMYWGDVTYLQQRQVNGDVPEVHQRIRVYYERSISLGQQFDSVRLYRLAETLIALHDDDAALAVLDQHQDEPAELRCKVIREIIERRLALDNGSAAPLLPILERYQKELGDVQNITVARQERVWVVGLQADAYLETRTPDVTIAFLSRELIRFEQAGGDRDLGPLLVRLGHSYARIGEYDNAQRQYRLARQRLDSSDPLNAQALVGLGHVTAADTADYSEALQYFVDADSQYVQLDFNSPQHPVYLAALIGRADCEARLGMHAEAMEHFGKAADLLRENPRPPQARVDELIATALAQHGVHYDSSQFEEALDYLHLVEPLMSDREAELVGKLADTHDRYAQQLVTLAQSSADAPPSDGPRTPQAREQLNRDAALHFERAANYYRRHAELVTMDDRAYSVSLWRAAECFDRAQLWPQAIDTWRAFVDNRAEDTRLLEAMNRLGASHQASGRYEEAILQFENLVTNYPRTPEAYASLVPLAQCYIKIDRVDDARRVLTSVINGHESITPQSQHYKAALIELGKLHFARGEFVPAIERFHEAVERYGDAPEGPMLRYRLAESYRRSIDELERTLAEPQPQSKALALRNQRADRLQRAQDLYGQVIADLEPQSSGRLSELERICLRNAYFYQADCAYDLGQYERAIALYDQAAKRWEHDPSSLIALIQIVNAYCEMGKTQEAKVANMRASDHFKRIPEDAFNDQSLPMTREHWQDWLRWTSELQLFADRSVVDEVEQRTN